MTRRRPARRDRPERSPRRSRAPSRSTSRSATASPPARGSPTASAGPSGSPTACGRSTRRSSYRNLAVDGATSAEVLEQLPEALELRARPGDGGLRRQRRAAHHAARPRRATRRPRRDPRPPARADPGARDRDRDRRPSAGTSWSCGPRTRRAGRARDRRAQRRDHAGRGRRHGGPCLEVAGHPGLCDRENFRADGLHPSPLGHRRAAQRLRAAAARPLRTSRSTIEGGDAMTRRSAATSTGSSGRRASPRAGGRSPRPTWSRFAALTGDWHPQHADAEWAARGSSASASRTGCWCSPTRRPGAVRPGPGGRAARPRLGHLQAAGADRRHDPRRARRVERVQAARRRARPRRFALAGRQPARPTVVAPGSRRCGARGRRGGSDRRLRRASRSRERERGAACDPRGQAHRRHGRRQPPLDRLLDRRARSAAGRRGAC